MQLCEARQKKSSIPRLVHGERTSIGTDMDNASPINMEQQAGMRLIRGSTFVFMCRVVGAALTFVSQVLLARWMGASELGIYVLAFSWCILLSSFATLGFPVAAIRFVGGGLATNDPGYIRGFVRRGAQIVALAGTLIGAVGITMLWSGWLLDDTPSRYTLTLALLIVPVFAANTFFAGVANGLSQLPLSFVPANVARPLLFLALVIATWFTTDILDANRVMSLQVLAIFVVSVVTIWMVRRTVDGLLDTEPAQYDTRTWARTSAPLLATALFTGYFPEINIILSGAYLPSDQVALFHVSFRLALLVSFALFAVDAVTGPEAARLHMSGDKTALQSVVDRATRLRFGVAVSAVLMFGITGKFLLGLFGEEFVQGYMLLIILAVAQLVQAAVGPVARLMSVSGHQDRCLVVFVVALLVLVALVAVLVPLFGATGAAIAAFIDMTIWALWMRYLVVRHLDIRPRIF
jgi:O-antigen/teichoic acid export membrane protein